MLASLTFASMEWLGRRFGVHSRLPFVCIGSDLRVVHEPNANLSTRSCQQKLLLGNLALVIKRILRLTSREFGHGARRIDGLSLNKPNGTPMCARKLHYWDLV